MTEEEKKEEPKEEEKKEEPVTPEETTPQASTLVDDANLAAARLERANKEQAKLLARQEALKVEQTLGGKAEAGPVKTELSDEEYAKKVLAGELI